MKRLLHSVLFTALAAGTASLAFHQPGTAAATLIDAGAAVTEVRIESVEGGAS